MQTAHQVTCGYLVNDICEAAIGIPGAGTVVEGEKNAGEGLIQEQEQCDASEDLWPAGGSRNIFQEKLPDRRL